jgi:hemerythrin-like domain-containing protein
MRTTEILMSEHRVIERVLLCLDKIADAAESARRLDVASGRDAVSFLKTFADRCHHMKEEERLFPAMERCGLPRDAGPTAVMRQEHEIGRGHVRGMQAALDAHEKGAPDALPRFVAEARGFTELLRDHIAKEDEVLFPMADRMLPNDVQEELLRGFEHAEKHELGDGVHEEFLAIADRLCERWGVTQRETKTRAHVCGCSHAH